MTAPLTVKNIRQMPSIRTVFETVFYRMQGDPEVNLEAWGKAHPKEFYNIISKLIPQDINLGGVQVRVISGVPNADGSVESPVIERVESPIEPGADSPALNIFDESPFGDPNNWRDDAEDLV